MTDDLVKRLHQWGDFGYGHEASKNMHEAADRIEQLEAALQLYAGLERDGIKWEPLNDNGGIARAALGEKKDG